MELPEPNTGTSKHGDIGTEESVTEVLVEGIIVQLKAIDNIFSQVKISLRFKVIRSGGFPRSARWSTTPYMVVNCPCTACSIFLLTRMRSIILP